MKKIILLIFISFSVHLANSQNKEILYNFANLPQTLMLNPSAKVNNSYHVGFPLVSQFSIQGGFTGFSFYDIFSKNGVDINDKIRDAVQNYGKSEFLTFNQTLDVINAGFRLKDNSYLSFGYYEEFDFLVKVPKDMIDLYYDGNSDINRMYSINKFAARADLLGVFHVGISKKINTNLRIGARLKIYSGAFNAITSRVNGSLSTQLGTTNLYTQNLNNIDALFQSSGMILENGTTVDASFIKKKMLLGGNLGLGIDVGFTRQLKNQWELSGSVLDLGFINNKKDVESYSLKGQYQIDGIQLLFDPNKPQDYWNNLKDDFNNNVVLDTIYKNYLTFRPVKLYGALTHSFGQEYDDCRFLVDPSIYLNKVGVQLFSTIGSIHSYLAATLFYERRLSKNLQSKITYTIDPFSYANIGIGLSTKLGIFNTYMALNNLLSLSNVYNAKSIGLQFGINFIVTRKN